MDQAALAMLERALCACIEVAANVSPTNARAERAVRLVKSFLLSARDEVLEILPSLIEPDGSGFRRPQGSP